MAQFNAVVISGWAVAAMKWIIEHLQARLKLPSRRQALSELLSLLCSEPTALACSQSRIAPHAAAPPAAAAGGFLRLLCPVVSLIRARLPPSGHKPPPAGWDGGGVASPCCGLGHT